MLAPYEKFQMKYYSPNVAPILRDDRFHLDQCLKNDLEREQMLNFHLYAYVCTRPDITFAIKMLGRYHSNSSMEHRKVEIKMTRYL